MAVVKVAPEVEIVIAGADEEVVVEAEVRASEVSKISRVTPKLDDNESKPSLCVSRCLNMRRVRKNDVAKRVSLDN